MKQTDPPITNTKVCGKCRHELPTAAFGPNASRPDGLQSMCRECRRKEYLRTHGGLRQVLRRFTTEELKREILRREMQRLKQEAATEAAFTNLQTEVMQ